MNNVYQRLKDCSSNMTYGAELYLSVTFVLVSKIKPRSLIAGAGEGWNREERIETHFSKFLSALKSFLT